MPQIMFKKLKSDVMEFPLIKNDGHDLVFHILHFICGFHFQLSCQQVIFSYFVMGIKHGPPQALFFCFILVPPYFSFLLTVLLIESFMACWCNLCPPIFT